MLAMLNWRFLKEPNSLWVKILKAKYLTPSRINNTRPINDSSTIWLKSGWDCYYKGLRWIIGNGNSVNAWSDNWTTLGPLSNLIYEPTLESDLFLKVSDLVQENGRWDLEKCSFVLPDTICKVINAILTPRFSPCIDKLVWGPTTDAIFFCKSTYPLQINKIGETMPHLIFKTIWSLDVIPHIKTFLWLAILDKLPSKFFLEKSFDYGR
ncbi:hypothetical protein CFOL_v3_01356 [Cephalotus follicularis]|uniref:Zf-RVT domain-containing protein n=1 Tax=Cephalotus follicularis TaxID=3775 RepID=A0A1Q3AQA6_CEPFO|nr:hypothetical protein CFOL_v3_01356 [Cephalotus follicularis]